MLAPYDNIKPRATQLFRFLVSPILGSLIPSSLLVDLYQKQHTVRTSVLTLLAFAGAVLASSASATTSKSAWVSSASNAASAAPPSASGISALTPCTLSCISLAAANSSCLSPTNITCVCTDPNFQVKLSRASARPQTATLRSHSRRSTSLSATAAPTATAPFIPSNSAADISASAVHGSGPSVSASPSVLRVTRLSRAASSQTGSARAMRLAGAGMGLSVAVALAGVLIGAVVML
ncbi:hypothetical protein C8R44DRAFT_870566 [Mycena epipterygia]|nr:hypothetical protein C8R44DRAFT_870566 [Mycena epipterygia]